MDTGALNLQLVELLTLLCDEPDAPRMALRAARWVGQALDAEIAAVVRESTVLAGVGLGDVVADVRVALASGDRRGPVDLSNLASAFVATAAVPDHSEKPAVMFVGRAGEDFDAGERLLLVGAGRLLAQSLVSARALQDEREQRHRSDSLAADRQRLLTVLSEREALLSRVLELQQAISHRLPLEEILDLLAAGARDVLGGDEVTLVLEDSLHPGQLQVAARNVGEFARGCSETVEHARAAVVAGREVAGDHDGCAWRAATVRAEGRVVGALVLLDPRRRTVGREHLLTPFSEHASTALNDSYTAASLRESYYDQLTRLPNRALFLDRLGAVARSAVPGKGPSLLFVDLDDFKGVNDRHGHEAGDAVLVACADRLREGIREEDFAARLGGDEFAVAVQESDPVKVAVIAERLAQRLREPVDYEGSGLCVSASIGVAVTGCQGTAAETLVRDADTAMYTVKALLPKTRTVDVAVFHAELGRLRSRRLQLETGLARAIEEDRGIVLDYQPCIALGDARSVGAEALVRWHHPQEGLLAPGVFIPLAEESGLVRSLGNLVLRRACAQWAEWRRHGVDGSVAVNLSAAQLTSELPGLVMDTLRATDLPASALVVEVTETVLVTEGETAAHVLQELRDLGVRVALDDFGTGYSSLSYLRQLPVDVLKIDRSFVSVLGTRQDDALVKTIVGLADALGLETVAEGIETPEQAAVLRSLGCRIGQGFHYARPMSAGDFGVWWQARRTVNVG